MIFDPDSVKKGNALAVPAVILVYLALLAILVVGCVKLFRRILIARK